MPNPKAREHPLSVICDCLFITKIKRRLNAGNAHYHSVLILSHSHFLTLRLKYRRCKTYVFMTRYLVKHMDVFIPLP